MIESMHLALENVVSAIFDGSKEYKSSTELQLSLHRIFEGLMIAIPIYPSIILWLLFSDDLVTVTSRFTSAAYFIEME